MRYLIIQILTLSLVFHSCKKQEQTKPNDKNNKQESISKIDRLIHNLENSNSKEVMVVAHRGDWRNAPENSLQAIQNCIDIGVDMVEIDIRETKDGHLILMHDETLDRTTKTSGLVKDFTLDSIKKIKLVDGLDIETPHKIPTLEEALLLSKDKILINLDKSYNIFDKCYEVVKKTNTLKQVVIKGRKTLNQVQQEFGEYLDKVCFMPIITISNTEKNDMVESYLQNDQPPLAIEFIVPDNSNLKLDKYFKEIQKRGTNVWVNALWASLCDGYDDEKAALDISIYDWYIKNNVNIIQTDRPKILLEFLRSKGLHH
ncbi:glycerophosphodiester phosphodiesterase family protein [Tenacibaculum xiamenense]|uniref:glycerophosphodiester phosphodiesterase family protein n=1 Tax=Tenacibaculum xiamenense TaxID=1261553 RepID=UPI003893625B